MESSFSEPLTVRWLNGEAKAFTLRKYSPIKGKPVQNSLSSVSPCLVLESKLVLLWLSLTVGS